MYVNLMSLDMQVVAAAVVAPVVDGLHEMHQLISVFTHYNG